MSTGLYKRLIIQLWIVRFRLNFVQSLNTRYLMYNTSSRSRDRRPRSHRR